MSTELKPTKAKKPQGFACLSPERRKEIASMAGKAAHAQGKAHRFTKEEATLAGHKGGLKISENLEHMSALGRKGAASTHKKVKKRIA